MTSKRYIVSGEALAIRRSEIRRDADGLFFFSGPESPENERHATYDDVAIVHARGSLEHHMTPGSDSYEAIEARIDSAMRGADGEESPSGVILCIDSRGGVVAGLNGTVERIRQLRKSRGVPLIAYVNEMAASAAYALACGADEILGPASCIVGSIGTNSTMFSVVKQDEAAGIDVRLITSGARKSDGHPHVAITDGAEAAERDRVMKLAQSFYELASEARGISVKKLAALQAGIFLGQDAVAHGLLDSVVSLDNVARMMSRKRQPAAAVKGNTTSRRENA